MFCAKAGLVWTSVACAQAAPGSTSARPAK
jgi:hypothetical protein